MKAYYNRGDPKKCAVCQDSMWKVVNQASNGFALIYLLRFMRSLNNVYHFGELMLGRVLADMLDGNEQFDDDLEDGTVFEKLLDFAQKHGIELEEDEISEAKFAVKLAEKGIGWHRKRRRGNRKSRIDEGSVEVELD